MTPCAYARLVPLKLTEAEQKLDSVERGAWQSIPDLEREAERYRKAARDTIGISHDLAARFPE